MRFVRRALAPRDEAALRALAARAGWLIETPNELRAGLGDVVDTLDLAHGLDRVPDARAFFARHDLAGEAGPAGTGVVAFCTLPFERDAPGRLEIPRYVLTQNRHGDAWLTTTEDAAPLETLLDGVEAPTQGRQHITALSYHPAPDSYAHQVARAVEFLRRKELDKVVLSRAVSGSVVQAVDPAAVAARLRERESLGTIYALPTTDGRRFVGASPELLAERRGGRLRCHPLAGTIALPDDVEPDDYETWLLGSTKNLHEHELLVDDLVGQLVEHYDDVSVDPVPSIVTLRTVAHLGTWIEARHESAASAPDALAVAALLHPTAAVGGIARDAARDLIARLEDGPRGHFAGPLGWIDEAGDGDWWIALRGVLLRGNEFEAWAGAGIVSESDPTAEREETKAKLAVVMSSLALEVV